MIDIVFPKDNEKEFIRLAERLGLDGLIFVYSRPKDISDLQKSSKISIASAVLCSPEDVRKYKGKHITICRAPDDQLKIRHIIEQARPDILFGLEFTRRRDFMHHRASGLNHVMASLAAQKRVSIGFSFSDILQADPKDKAIFMGRMMQNIRFARKFRFNIALASFANSPWHMRAPHDLKSFFITIGMEPSVAKKSLGFQESQRGDDS